jgi:hypothetical protein
MGGSRSIENLARIGVALLLLALAGCGAGGDTAPAAAGPDAAAAGDGLPAFVDTAAEAGLESVAVCGNAAKAHLLESTGSGVAVADYDGDGDDDLYFATAQTTDDWLAGRRPRTNALYRNDGHGTFTDLAAEAGVDLAAWSAGTYFVDYDDDGDKDLFVTTWGPNVLYRNDGDGTFTDVTRQAGVAGGATDWSASAAFGDLDGDGDLDLYVANYCVYDLADPPFGGSRTNWKGIQVYRGPLGFEAQADRLYRNDGDGTFTDVSDASGIGAISEHLFGLGVAMSDLDDDGDLDVYVANDSTANFLWRNDGGLRFSDVANMAGVATNEDAKQQAGMGTDIGDYNDDGRLDVVVTNFSHDWNTLYRNDGGGFFTDATFEAGLRDGYLPLAWGTKLFDYDNDGRLDLFVANGHIYPEIDDHPQLKLTYKEENLLYRNLGGGRFENVVERSGPGMRIVEGTRGVAVADLDRDGDLDLVLTNIDSTPSLLRNDGGNRGAWLSVRLVGTRANRDAIGSRLTLTAGDTVQVREVNPFGSYQSQSSYAVHFGLGDAEAVERLEIRWPDGEVETLTDLPTRAFLTVTQGSGVTESQAP